jgi:hypothetical protein
MAKPIETDLINESGSIAIGQNSITHRLSATKSDLSLPYAGIATKNTDPTAHAAIEYGVTGGKTLFTGLGGPNETLAGLADKYFVYDLSAGATRFVVDTDGRFAIGNNNVDPSAQLQVDSTVRGFLPPRMTSAQRIAIATPAEGLLVFDTDLNTLCEYSGASWKFELRLNTSAIQTSTSSTYSNVTQMVTPSLEAGLYVLELKGIMQSTVITTGVGLRLFNGTAAVSTVNVNWGFSQAVSGTDKVYEYSQLNLADNIASASVITANTNFPVFGNGVFRITTAGTMAIQIRSEVNLSGVSIRPDSTVMFKKIG